jgi:predicted RNase H-like HicB family nuclease
MSHNKPMIGFRIKVVIEPDDVGFHVYCPALRGLHTYGDTQEKALENAKNAAIAYLESLIKHNDPIPVGLTVEKPRKGPEKTDKGGTRIHTQELEVACAT